MGTRNICLYKEVDKKKHWLLPEGYGIACLCADMGRCSNQVEYASVLSTSLRKTYLLGVLF